MKTRALLLTILSALLLCGVAGAAASQSGAGPDPAVAEWPQWPHQVACLDSVPFDPVSAFSAPADAQRGRLPSERALRRFLKTHRPGKRVGNWRLVAASSDTAEFTSGRLGSSLDWLKFERAGGVWKFAEEASCEPETLRRGEAATPWYFVVPHPPLTTATHRVEVALAPELCGDGAKARLEKPEFREENGMLVMTIWRRPPPRHLRHCHSGDDTIAIELPEALGHRNIVDGSIYPPEPAFGPNVTR